MISEKDNAYVSSLKKRGEEGDVFALSELASFYYEDNPRLMKENLGLVLDSYERAAEAGCQIACLNLGRILSDGKYVSPDYGRAAELFRSAKLGESGRIAAIASSELGDFYLLGKGVKADYAKAFDLYLEGALLCGHPVSLYKLGDMYRLGQFVSQSGEMAYLIYSKAKSASQRFNNEGYAEILVRLAEAKLFGIGTERNLPEAMKYIDMSKRLACKSRSPEKVAEATDSLLERIEKSEI